MSEVVLPPDSSASWRLFLPPSAHILCFAAKPPKLVQELIHSGIRVDIVTDQPPAGNYDLVILWEPQSMTQLRGWLAELHSMQTLPVELALWCHNRWLGTAFKRVPLWWKADALLEENGWRVTTRQLGLPGPHTIRQIVNWEAYQATPLIKHKRSHKAWKAWVRQRSWFKYFQPLRFVRASRSEVSAPSLLSQQLEAVSKDLVAGVTVKNHLVSPNGTTIIPLLIQNGRDRQGVLKISYCKFADSRLLNNAAALKWMEAKFGGHPDWSPLAPRLLALGSRDGCHYSVEQWVEGSEVQGWTPEPRLRALWHLSGFLETLATVGSSEMDAPTALEKAHAADVEACTELLETDLAQRLQRTWQAALLAVNRSRLIPVPRHGDFKLENVLGNPRRPQAVRVLDWELWQAEGLPLMDAIHLVLSTRRREHGVSIGASIRRWLFRDQLDSTDKRVVQRLISTLDPSYLRVTPLLYWLDRVGPVARRGAWPSEEWKATNVVQVLREMDSSKVEVWA